MKKFLVTHLLLWYKNSVCLVSSSCFQNFHHVGHVCRVKNVFGRVSVTLIYLQILPPLLFSCSWKNFTSPLTLSLEIFSATITLLHRTARLPTTTVSCLLDCKCSS